MTITVASNTPTGTYPITVTGTGGGIHQSATVTLTVTAPPSFTIAASPSSLTVAEGNLGISTITTAVANGFNSAISLSASGAPSGTTVSFSPNPIPAPGSGSSTMTITVGSATPMGTYPITVTGNGGGTQQTTTVTLTVTAPPNFTLTVSPVSLSIAQGHQGTSTVTTAISGGFNSSIALSASGMPTGASVSFNPAAIPAPGSGTSTMTITVGSATPAGTYPITVTGTGGGVQQNAVVDLTVTVSSGAISYVQGNYATPQSPQSSVTVTFTGAQVAGDLNVIAVGWNDSTATVSSVRDTEGNVYSLAVGPTIQSGIASQSIYYAKNIATAAAGANAVTVTFTSAAVSPDIRILEYVGADPNNPVDVTAASSGNSASSSSGSATTTNATDLIFGANLVQTLTSGPGSGFTSRLLTVPDGDIAEDQMVASTGSYSATAPVSPAGSWIMQMVAFRTPALGSFTIAASPASLSIAQGNQATSTITIAISGGFNSAISLSASGVPAGTTVTFNPTSIPAPGSGNSTMTINVGANTTAGSYPITVTGNGGGIQQTTTVTFDRHCWIWIFHRRFACFCQHYARHPGNINHYDCHWWWLQQRDQSVSVGNAYRYNGYLQSHLDPGPGFGQLNHDDHCRIHDPDGDLSHHSHGNWRWNPSDGDGNSHGHCAGQSVLEPQFIAGNCRLQRLSQHGFRRTLHQDELEPRPEYNLQ